LTVATLSRGGKKGKGGVGEKEEFQTGSELAPEKTNQNYLRVRNFSPKQGKKKRLKNAPWGKERRTPK